MNFSLPFTLAIAATCGLASATVVNIDFNSSTGGTQVGQVISPLLLADPGGATAYWNPIYNVSGTAQSANLFDSTSGGTGAGTGLSFFLSGIESGQNQGGGEQDRTGAHNSLMRDYIRLDSGSNSAVNTLTGTFGGLVVGGTYDLYFYAQGNNFGGLAGSSDLRGQNSLITVGASGKQTSWDGLAGGDGSLVEGIEYVKFTAIANGSGEISFDWANVIPSINGPDKDGIASGSRFAGLNGIQLVSVVPEPSSLILGMIGALGLIRRRR